MAENAPTHKEELKIVNDLIKDIDVAMFTTIVGNKPVSRPLQTQEAEFDGDLWFLTLKDTDKYQEILQNPSVNVAYAGKSYVSISGSAQFIDDLERKKEYWNPVFDKLLNTTYDDPNVILIKVTAETAEYWESGNMTKTVKNFAKKLTGNEDEGDKKQMNDTVEFN
ncbi:pyridoxamine 5'-phosphate oxidase family protein [Planomicrobium sp. Y74]|uniref:pyridoxamine 5'-phosphate oxidase family protein n=1 Tax=Planomicrobium sp. Y74 TaxID=2478977 RepID=UPI000EF4D5C3|nr:pyridoxamine 5'-phosphate oxidase family protein [Planomicrobium sp. Y74]RLQ91487.1 general stress protein [Planomicrobium sp. Y74]